MIDIIVTDLCLVRLYNCITDWVNILRLKSPIDWFTTCFVRAIKICGEKPTKQVSGYYDNHDSRVLINDIK